MRRLSSLCFFHQQQAVMGAEGGGFACYAVGRGWMGVSALTGCLVEVISDVHRMPSYRVCGCVCGCVFTGVTILVCTGGVRLLHLSGPNVSTRIVVSELTHCEDYFSAPHKIDTMHMLLILWLKHIIYCSTLRNRSCFSSW